MFDHGLIPGQPDGTASAEAVRSAFDSITTQAQTRWSRQHNRHGGHTDITCDSIVIPKLRFEMARGNDAMGRIFVRDVGANGANGVPLVLGPDVTFVSIKAPGGSTYLLYGIQKQDVKYGDLIFVRKDPRSAANIELRDRVVASVPAGTEIHVPQDCAASYPSFFLSTSGAWLPLVYSPGAGTGNVAGWSFFYTYSL